VLIVNLDSLLRISSILFFPYLAQRIEEDFRQKTLLRILLADEATAHSANAGGQIDLFAAVEVHSSGQFGRDPVPYDNSHPDVTLYCLTARGGPPES
jgi:hypothetical protein